MSTKHHISDELLINYLLGECTASEKEAVENWIALSEENKKHYESFSQVWDKSKSLIDTVEVDENAAWERLEERMQKRVKKSKQLSFRRRVSMLAASIALLVGVFLTFNKLNDNPIANDKPTVTKTDLVIIDTPIVQTIASTSATKITSLADESVITLNKKSTLTTTDTFVNDERRVALKGEAFFSITPDKAKPFIIETQANVEIRVVGTSFNVKSFADYTEVIVETGIVELTKGNSVMRLVKNDKARIYSKDSIIKVEKKTDDLYKYYRSKTFDCDNTPLWKVVEVLNEAYDEKIIIKNQSLRNLKLDTQIDQEPFDIIMQVLEATFEFTVTKKRNTYYITE